MCRMLAVVSRDPIALDAAIAEELEPFTEQSRLHRDGWGVGWYSAAQIEQALDGGADGADGGADGTGGGADGADGREDGSDERARAAASGLAVAAREVEAVAGALSEPLPVRRTPQIRRRIDPAFEDVAYREALAEATGPMMLVHLRKASPGLPLQLTNTHPFREGEAVFAHNGQFDLPDGLREAILARGGRRPEGTTDSELFLSLIDAQLRDAAPSSPPSAYAADRAATTGGVACADTIATAIQRAAAELTALELEIGTRVPEPLNCLYMTPDLLIAYQQSDPAQAKPYHEADNYTLRYQVAEDRVIVATSGIPAPGWSELADGHCVVVSREDLSVVVVPPLD